MTLQHAALHRALADARAYRLLLSLALANSHEDAKTIARLREQLREQGEAWARLKPEIQP